MSISSIRPLSDWVLIKRYEYEHPVLAVIGVRLEKGVIVALGPGKRQRRKVRFDLDQGHLSTSRSLYFEDGEETGRTWPIGYKVGDVVEFSPRNQTEWEHEGEKYVWVKKGAIYGKSIDSKSTALMFQTVAGTDRHGNFMSGQE